jgi:hypothetical protein
MHFLTPVLPGDTEMLWILYALTGGVVALFEALCMAEDREAGAWSELPELAVDVAIVVSLALILALWPLAVAGWLVRLARGWRF